MKTLINKVNAVLLLLLLNFSCFSQTTSVMPGAFNNTQLQWILAVPNEKWSVELANIASLLENKKTQQADAALDDWLKRDFYQALSALPAMDGFFSYFADNNLANVFAKHLIKQKSEQAIELLAQLDLANHSVRQVGFLVMKNWWQQDQQTMQQWLKATPSFFEDLYLETFIQEIQNLQHDANTLATLFFSLPTNDNRRTRYFSQIIEQWLRYDLSSAATFVKTQLTNKQGQKDAALDKAAVELSYRFAYQKNYQQALMWLSYVSDIESRENSVRDHSLSINNDADKSIFVIWLAQHPLLTPELQEEVAEHLASLSDSKNNNNIDHDDTP